MTNFNFTPAYFSFLGNCNAAEVFKASSYLLTCEDGVDRWETDQLGEFPKDTVRLEYLHSVGGSDWSIHLYNTSNPKLVYVQSKRRDDWTACETWYLAERSSFDCSPAVPVESFGKELAAALS